MDHVISADQNNPPHLFSNWVKSSCNLQHIDLTAPGLYASGLSTLVILPFLSLVTLNCDPMKFWKYGIPYFAVISKSRLMSGSSHGKSSVILYVGIGNVNTDHVRSPAVYTSIRILLSIFISSSSSLNFFG